jgi:hypothetical protein
MTMAAGKIDRHQIWIAPHQVGHDGPRAIGRAVVQHNELVVGPDRVLSRRRDAPVEFFEACFLVEARCNDGEPRA